MTTTADFAEAYCRMLSWMVELLWRHELPVLISSPEFAAATTIVDVGAGPGTFGRRLAAAYPEKHFLGVEPDAAIFAVGARSAGPPNYRYLHAGYETVAGTHDLVLARFLVMYLPNRDEFYAWAREHARAAIVVNRDDAAIGTEPPMPRVVEAVKQGYKTRAHELSTTFVNDSDLSNMTAEWLAAGFLPTGVATLELDESDPDDRRIFHHIVRTGLMAANPRALTRAVVDEVYEWSLDPAARVRYGMTYHSMRNLPWPAGRP